jgi:hypothetical protein
LLSTVYEQEVTFGSENNAFLPLSGKPVSLLCGANPRLGENFRRFGVKEKLAFGCPPSW